MIQLLSVFWSGEVPHLQSGTQRDFVTKLVTDKKSISKWRSLINMTT